MIAKVKDAGYTLCPAVERALRTVHRHLFVPDATLEETYKNDIVITKKGHRQQGSELPVAAIDRHAPTRAARNSARPSSA